MALAGAAAICKPHRPSTPRSGRPLPPPPLSLSQAKQKALNKDYDEVGTALKKTETQRAKVADLNGKQATKRKAAKHLPGASQQLQVTESNLISECSAVRCGALLGAGLLGVLLLV